MVKAGVTNSIAGVPGEYYSTITFSSFGYPDFANGDYVVSVIADYYAPGVISPNYEIGTRSASGFTIYSSEDFSAFLPLQWLAVEIGSNNLYSTSGVSGTSGTSGANGASGTPGTPGTSGTSGVNGPSGTSGTSGVNGTDTSSVIENAQTVSYQIALTDVNKLVSMTSGSAITLTVPLNSTTAFPVGSQILVVRGGAGAVNIAGAVGVTINSALTYKYLNFQYSSATLIKTGTDTWYLFGDLKATA
jgi:hypothetical protein